MGVGAGHAPFDQQACLRQTQDPRHRQVQEAKFPGIPRRFERPEHSHNWQQLGNPGIRRFSEPQWQPDWGDQEWGQQGRRWKVQNTPRELLHGRESAWGWYLNPNSFLRTAHLVPRKLCFAEHLMDMDKPRLGLPSLAPSLWLFVSGSRRVQGLGVQSGVRGEDGCYTEVEKPSKQT